MRKCPFHNCDTKIKSTQFVCERHWFSLSIVDQQRIQWAYREFRKGGISGDELRAIQQKVLCERGIA